MNCLQVEICDDHFIAVQRSANATGLDLRAIVRYANGLFCVFAFEARVGAQMLRV